MVNSNSNHVNQIDQITFCSYNVKNYDIIKYDAVKALFERCTFLLLQETWLAEEEFIRRFKNDFPYSECISSNKMDMKEIGPGIRYEGVGMYSAYYCVNTKANKLEIR